MGSVIGLADGAGQSAAKFSYDSFGNLRTSSGAAANAGEAGGDFRFQGQWLEAGTGIYHFRSRDYEPRTGTFLSRDPVDIIETEPESFNPYQFVYNNPYVYSDSTGMFTITELNAAEVVNDILQKIQAADVNQIRQSAIDAARGVVGDLVKSVIARFVPFEDDIIKNVNKLDDLGNKFEDILTENICGLIGDSYRQYLNDIWFESKVNPQTGNPVSDGFNCGEANVDLEKARAKVRKGIQIARPDFIIKHGAPYSTDPVVGEVKGDKAWLIGDFKATVQKAYYTAKKKESQWLAMLNYADRKHGHQYAPVALSVTFFGGKQGQIESIKKRSFERSQVLVEVVSFMPWIGK